MILNKLSPQKNNLKLFFWVLLANFSTLILFYDKMRVTECLADTLEEREKTFYYYKFAGFEYASNFLTTCLIDYIVSIFFLSIFYSICFQYFQLSKGVNIKRIISIIISMIIYGYLLFVIMEIIKEKKLLSFFNLSGAYLLYFYLYINDMIIFIVTTTITTFLFSKRKQILNYWIYKQK